MQPTRIQFSDDERTQWAGYGDFILVSPDGSHTVELIYKGEPPHGDSYHAIAIDGHLLPGLAWGCLFGFSACSRYLVFSWMARRIERKTMVVDMAARRCFVLPVYIPGFRVEWPAIIGEPAGKADSYRFTGSEDWSLY